MPGNRPRARDLGIPFDGKPGRWNAITDVPGVQVGYATLIEGDAVRTGVTAIHPRGADGAGDPVTAGFCSLNGNGEMTGVSWIEESGTFSGPVGITNTHAVGVVHQAIVAWTAQRHPPLAEHWLLPVVGETWDGYLNDINGGHVTVQAGIEALATAAGGDVAEGSVGGGTGMICYGFKGGSGTASRLVGYAGSSYAVGVFVQANFGGRGELTLAGVPVGRLIPAAQSPAARPDGAGSVIAIVGTDAPLLPGQCKALARRVSLGLARTGTVSSHFSGDLFLAFATGNPGAVTPPSLDGSARAEPFDLLRFVPWGRMDPFYAAVVQATEEAVANALAAGQDMTGRDGRFVPGLPAARVAELIKASAMRMPTTAELETD